VVRRRDVFDVCLVILLADVVSGAISPTLSLYARSLGASLGFLGVLAATVGVVRLTLSVPIGALSDVSRKWVLVGGMLVFAASAFAFAAVPSAALLVLPNGLFGLAQIATFSIGVAYLGDHLSTDQRALGISLYATAMGLGFGIGPALGGWLEQAYSFPVAYAVVGVIALTGAAYAAVSLKSRPTVAHAGGRLVRGASLRALGTDRRIWAACLGQTLMSLAFSVAILTFFPVLAQESLGLTAAAVGTIFSIRAFASTAMRLPAGLAEILISSRWLMIVAVGIEALTLIGLQATGSVVVLIGVLAIEGISYGMFLTCSQEFVAQLTTPRSRGAAMGVFTMAGSLGQSGGAILLGLTAQAFGVRSVFAGVAAVLLVGIVGMIPLSRTLREPGG
jgi:MFS family permease